MVTRRSAARPAHRGTTGMTLYERVLAHEIDMMLLRIQDGAVPFEVAAEAARPALEEVLQAQMLASAQAAYAEVGQDPRLRNPWTPVAKQVEIPEVEFGGPAATFNVVARTHAEAVDQTTNLITNMSAASRIAMRGDIRRGFTVNPDTGLPDTTDQIARRIFDRLSADSPVGGLTAPQAATLDRIGNARFRSLLDAGVDVDAAAARTVSAVRVEADRMRKFRARMIARTEVMTASNRGRRTGVFEAEAQDLISSNSKRKWVATAGACKICRSVNRTEVGLRESWPIGEPPAHPQCRCTWVLVPAEVAIPTSIPDGPLPSTLPPIPQEFVPEKHAGLPAQVHHSQRWPLQQWWQEEVLDETFGYTQFDTLPDSWDISLSARKEALRALREKRPAQFSQEDRGVLDLFDKRMRTVDLRGDQTLTRSIRVENDPYENWLDLWDDPGDVGEEFAAIMPESFSLSPEWSTNFAPMEVQPLQLPTEGAVDLIITAKGRVRAMGVRADKANELELIVSQGQRMRILSRRETVEEFDVLPSAIPAEAGTATEIRRIYLEVEFID